jgi:excisionase family DNA binding protein
MSEKELTAETRARLHAMIDERLDRLRDLLRGQADALLEHAEALAREAAASKPAEGDNAIYSRKDVARILSCSPSTVDNLVRRGELKYTFRWAGGSKCFTREQIDEYIERLNRRGEEGAKKPRK